MKKNSLKKVVLGVCGICALLVIVLSSFSVKYPKAEWIYLVEIVLSLAIMGMLIYSVKGRHSTVKIVLIMLLGFVFLSWILPAAYYSGGYVPQGRVQMGIFDLFSYPLSTLSYFSHIVLYVLVVGGFHGILYLLPAYRKLLDSVSKVLGKNKIVSLSIIMSVIAILTSFCGVQLGLIMFFPFIIAIILLMGYDKFVAALTVVGSTMIGIAGTTYAYNNVSVIVGTLGIKIDAFILFKILILVFGLALLIFNTIMYTNGVSKKAKKKPSNKSKATKKAKTTKTEEKSLFAAKMNDYMPVETKKKANVWPIVVVLCVSAVILVLSFISWAGAFNNGSFEKATSAVSEFKVFDFPLFGKILGKSLASFGSWTVNEMIALMIIAAGLLMLIYKIKLEDGIQAFINGAKRALEPAVLIFLIYTGLVIVTYHPFQLVVYKALFGITKGFNVITSLLAGALSSVFNSVPLYAFNQVVPYLSTLVSGKGTYGIISVVYPAVYGLTMLVAPTSIMLMLTLSYLDISYIKWIKNIWKLLVELLIMLLVVFIILVLI